MGQTQQEGRDQAGGREGGQPTRGPVAQRGATPHRTPAQRRVRQATRPAGSMAIPSANDPTRASTTRASGRIWQWGSLSLVQRGAPRCTDAPNSAATRARLSRAARRLVRNPQRPTRPASHPRPRPSPRAWLRARVRMRNAACAMARRAVSAHPHGPSASHARMARREGGSEGHSRQQPTPHYLACVYASLPLPHERTPEETKPDSRDVTRLACAAPPRVSRDPAHAPGGEGGQSAVTALP